MERQVAQPDVLAAQHRPCDDGVPVAVAGWHLQAWASISKGMWFARSPAVIHSQLMENLVWLRVPGDIVFGLGMLFLALFALRLSGIGSRKQPQLATVRK